MSKLLNQQTIYWEFGTVDSKYNIQVGKSDKVFFTVIVMVENIFDGYGEGDGEKNIDRR